MRFLIATILILGFADTSQALAVGSAAPGFNLTTPEGKKVSLVDYRGQMVLIKIGTTWCPGCLNQTRQLQRLDDFLIREGVPLLDVFVGEEAQTVIGYRRDFPLKGPGAALLGGDRFSRDYGVYLIPRLILLDQAQKVVFDGNGLNADQIRVRYLQATGTSAK